MRDRIGAILDKIGTENFARWIELRQMAGPQFFTPDEVTAKEFAGDKGFVWVIEVDAETAREHYQGMQIMQPGKEQRYNDNFVFNGKELGQNLDKWKMDLIEMEKERAEVEKRERRDPFRPIMSGDKDAQDEISRFRESLRKKDEGPKSPPEGKPPVR